MVEFQQNKLLFSNNTRKQVRPSSSLLRELRKNFSKECISEAASGKFTDKFYLDR